MLCSSGIVGGMSEAPVPMSGRRAEAARNDDRILEAARAVFIADPGAPISAVAKQAGVGISALYRRYQSKEALLHELAATSLNRYIDAVEAALAAEGDAWSVFVDFAHEVIDSDTQSLAQRLAGTFTPSPQLYEAAQRGQTLNVALFERTMKAGVLRADLTVEDVSLVLEMVMTVRLSDHDRNRQLRHRYLDLLLDGMHKTDADALPGWPPTWLELAQRWQTAH
jgi:AcrR family transcriptional regulator